MNIKQKISLFGGTISWKRSLKKKATGKKKGITLKMLKKRYVRNKGKIQATRIRIINPHFKYLIILSY